MLVLASASPRRKELLGLLVEKFDILPADIDETPRANEVAEKYVVRMALEKALATIVKYKQQKNVDLSSVFIASDTCVVVDDIILGKPESFDDAKRMLKLLSGRSHKVMTSLCISNLSEEQIEKQCVITNVFFRPISDVEIEQYWNTGEPKDKAGSYAIQGLGSVFVESISGSYSAVVGLPLFETGQQLKKFGIHSLEEMSHE